MLRWARLWLRVGERGLAAGAGKGSARSGAFDMNWCRAGRTRGWRVTGRYVVELAQRATAWAGENVAGMTARLGEPVSGEEVISPCAVGAHGGLDPEEVLDRSVVPAVQTGRRVELPNHLLHERGDARSLHAHQVRIQGRERLAYDPVGHRIDVAPDHIESQAVGLEQGGSPAHERVRNRARQGVRLPIGVG